MVKSSGHSIHNGHCGFKSSMVISTVTSQPKRAWVQIRAEAFLNCISSVDSFTLPGNMLPGNVSTQQKLC